MKRVTVLLLVLLLIPGLIAVPASASTQGVIDAIWDTHDDLGEWLGTALGDLRDLLQDTVDRLDWLDDSVRGVETQVINILEEIYTNGTLTIGECVKGIRSYVVSIAGYLDTGVEFTIGQFMSRFDDLLGYINGHLYEVKSSLSLLLEGDFVKADQFLEDSPPLQTEMDDFEEILSTAPTIDEDAFDTALGDVNGKFNGITTDENGAVLFGAFGQLANTQPLSVMIPTSAMLAVLSFALFGRTF